VLRAPARPFDTNFPPKGETLMLNKNSITTYLHATTTLEAAAQKVIAMQSLTEREVSR